MDPFYIEGLSPLETQCIANLAASDSSSVFFRTAARDAHRAGAFVGCKTLGEYAIAFLKYQLAYLEKYQPTVDLLP